MSYDESLASSTDVARALLGDTSNDANELLTDDHIAAVIGLYAPLPSAVAFLADELAARFARKPGSVSLPSGLSVSWTERVKYWTGLAARMRTATSIGGGGAFAVAGRRTDGYASPADEFARLSQFFP